MDFRVSYLIQQFLRRAKGNGVFRTISPLFFDLGLSD